jgi:hypothetical protein
MACKALWGDSVLRINATHALGPLNAGGRDGVRLGILRASLSNPNRRDDSGTGLPYPPALGCRVLLRLRGRSRDSV